MRPMLLYTTHQQFKYLPPKLSVDLYLSQEKGRTIFLDLFGAIHWWRLSISLFWLGNNKLCFSPQWVCIGSE